jgi:putative DNA primase/helicase
MNPQLQAALAYAERGWPVFPCAASKRPLIAHGHVDASLDPEQVRTWWARHPHALIGVPTGSRTDFWVLDVDDVEAFRAAYPWVLPRTRRSKTGKGLHYYFAWQADMPIRNAQRSPRGWPFRELPGAEVRGEGGYVIVPPSKHPSGAAYLWEEDAEILPAPLELLSRLAAASNLSLASGRSVSRTVTSRVADKEAMSTLGQICERITVAENGSQEKALNDGSLLIGGQVATGALDEAQAFSALVKAGLMMHSYDPHDPWTPEQIRKKVERGLRDGGRLADNRSTIRIIPGAIHQVASEAESALIRGRVPFYRRAGAIVRPIAEELLSSKGQLTKTPTLVPVDVDMMVDHLARTSRWVRYDSRRENKEQQVNPPREVARTILARAGEWRFPSLSGVSSTPSLRPDGSLLHAEGYDPSTRMLLLELPTLPSLPEKPTKEDALGALSELESLLTDFPFRDDVSRSVALSGLITPVVRGAMTVAPLHAVTAPVAGSGKSYLVDVISALLTGDRAAVIAAGRTEEETEKRLVAALLGGQPIISIDNVNGGLGGDLLCQLVERPSITVRPLGKSDAIRVESRATVFATGNNLHLVGDMTRRVLVCALDPRVEQPELRTFRTEPFQEVVSRRGQYVAAALTITRAYLVAGCPNLLTPLASFEDWSRLVRSALVWLSMADPLDSMKRARKEDPVLANLRVLLPPLEQITSSQPVTAGAIKSLATAPGTVNEELADALLTVAEGRTGEIDPNKLGRYFSTSEGRIVDGLKLTSVFDQHAKQKKWRVMRV